jgi:hypothetical protein
VFCRSCSRHRNNTVSTSTSGNINIVTANSYCGTAATSDSTTTTTTTNNSNTTTTTTTTTSQPANEPEGAELSWVSGN